MTYSNLTESQKHEVKFLLNFVPKVYAFQLPLDKPDEWNISIENPNVTSQFQMGYSDFAEDELLAELKGE